MTNNKGFLNGKKVNMKMLGSQTLKNLFEGQTSAIFEEIFICIMGWGNHYTTLMGAAECTRLLKFLCNQSF